MDSSLQRFPLRIKHSCVYESKYKECFAHVLSVVFGNCQPEGNAKCIQSHYCADRRRKKFFGSCEKRIVDAPDDMILRYDLTSELIPHVVSGKLEGAFYHTGNVVRKVGDVLQEILQCDLDFIGTYERMEKDAQCIATICNVLRELHVLGSVEIRLNHCALFKGILQRCGVPEELHAEIKNKLLEPNGQTDWMDLRQVHDINKLQDYLRRKGGKGLLRDLEHDEELMTYPEVNMQRVIDDLTHFLHLCEEKGVPTEQCVFHLNLVQELDYYDGLMFQAVHVPDRGGMPSLGMLACGGRYDDLAKGAYPGECSGQKFPGVGFTFVMESVVDLYYSHGTQLPFGNSSDIRSISRHLLNEHEKLTTLLNRLQHNMANAMSGGSQEDCQIDIDDNQTGIEIPLETVSGKEQSSDANIPSPAKHVCGKTCSRCKPESGVTQLWVQPIAALSPPRLTIEHLSPASTTNQKQISIHGQEQGPSVPTEYVAEHCSAYLPVKTPSNRELEHCTDQSTEVIETPTMPILSTLLSLNTQNLDTPVQAKGPSEPSELVMS